MVGGPNHGGGVVGLWGSVSFSTGPQKLIDELMENWSDPLELGPPKYHQPVASGW